METNKSLLCTPTPILATFSNISGRPKDIHVYCLKDISKIPLNRLNVHFDQAGLIKQSLGLYRGTIFMIFTTRRLQEKCQEQIIDLYMTFVDLTKAFDIVSRDGLWKIMAKVGCLPRFTAMVRKFYDGMQSLVQNSGKHSHFR